jgi:hypothetical protein
MNQIRQENPGRQNFQLRRQSPAAAPASAGAGEELMVDEQEPKGREDLG